MILLKSEKLIPKIVNILTGNNFDVEGSNKYTVYVVIPDYQECCLEVQVDDNFISFEVSTSKEFRSSCKIWLTEEGIDSGKLIEQTTKAMAEATSFIKKQRQQWQEDKTKKEAIKKAFEAIGTSTIDEIEEETEDDNYEVVDVKTIWKLTIYRPRGWVVLKSANKGKTFKEMILKTKLPASKVLRILDCLQQEETK